MDQINFGKYLRKLRKEKGLTLIELSNKSGVSNPYLSQLENGKYKSSPEILKKLSIIFNVPYSFLLHEAGYTELYEAAKFAEAVDDFKDDIDIASISMKASAVDKAQDIKSLLEQDSLILKTENIYPKYNGHILTEQDRERVLGMLRILFPEYQEPGNE